MNSIRTLSSISPVLGLLLWSVCVQSQDIHWSQFGNSPINLSPALAGVFSGDMRFVGNYRNQWRSVPVPYTTFSGTVENKFYLKKGVYNRFLTGAILVNYDKQGALELGSLQIGIPLALTAPIGKSQYLTFGLTPQFGQRTFQTNKVTFDEQWDGCFFNGGITHTEEQLLANTNLKYFDLAAGVNFQTRAATKRSKLNLGAALHHLNRPDHNFWTTTTDYKLASKTTLYALSTLQLTGKADLVGHGLYQKQGTYQEIVYGIGGLFHLNQKPYQQLAIQAGVDFRHRYTDAIVPHVEVHYRNWQVGFTYDINTSGFKVGTNNRGGPEVSLIHLLERVKPPAAFKICPII